LDVLRLVAGGRTNSEIAAVLFVSPKTVQHHITAILGKLGATSRRDAASLAAERGIIEPGEGRAVPI
jgi:DNA-binding NarL/FixJ family response regulator